MIRTNFTVFGNDGLAVAKSGANDNEEDLDDGEDDDFELQTMLWVPVDDILGRSGGERDDEAKVEAASAAVLPENRHSTIRSRADAIRAGSETGMLVISEVILRKCKKILLQNKKKRDAKKQTESVAELQKVSIAEI